jgi:hypothetical protein
MVAIPTAEEEDAKRPNRERDNLVIEQTRIVNEVKAILIRFGIRGFRPKPRKAEDQLRDLRTAEGSPLPENICAELCRYLCYAPCSGAIDTSIVRVHQHGASINRSRTQSMRRSRGGMS